MVSYEEQVTAIREQLAELLEEEEDWAKAAKVLAGIDLDSGVCQPPKKKSFVPNMHTMHTVVSLSLPIMSVYRPLYLQ